jgi:NAD(P)-dependent dehydrogenase (short-subunit alcohol dehydrogenase family)
MSDLARYRRLFDLTGKTALVIGAGSGIGEAAAYGLAAFGAHVICADLNEPAAERVGRSITEQGGDASSVMIDLTQAERVREVIEGEPQRPLDIVVCTPAVNVRKPLLAVSPAEFDKVVTLNLKGSFLAMQAAGRRMAHQGHGSIILLASIRALTVEPGQGVYAATKAGIVQMVRALAAELGPMGIRVNAIAPGVVETPLTAPIKEHPGWYRAYADKSALGRWAQPLELSGAVVYLASDAASFVTGSLLLVDGGWTAIDGRFTPPL